MTSFYRTTRKGSLFGAEKGGAGGYFFSLPLYWTRKLFWLSPMYEYLSLELHILGRGLSISSTRGYSRRSRASKEEVLGTPLTPMPAVSDEEEATAATEGLPTAPTSAAAAADMFRGNAAGNVGKSGSEQLIVGHPQRYSIGRVQFKIENWIWWWLLIGTSHSVSQPDKQRIDCNVCDPPPQCLVRLDSRTHTKKEISFFLLLFSGFDQLGEVGCYEREREQGCSSDTHTHTDRLTD